jgi:LemA protein
MGKIIGLVILAAFALFIYGGVNTVPTLQEKVNASWAEVQNQYQRRADLIPNLVETVKGYANFEKETLTAVINARASATKITLSPEMLNDPQAMQKFEQAQGQLSSALSHLMVVSERYPELKANQNFIALQAQLEGTENRIAIARKDYIDTVQEYNTTIRTFPGVIWAHIYGAQPKQTFTATQGADTPPAVKF